VHPHLLKAVQDARTQEVRGHVTEAARETIARPENIAIVRSAMVDVTRPGGTMAQAGAGATYPIAAKTGTAQVVGMKQGEKYDEKRLKQEHWDHALLIAFAPADDPKLALAILVENGKHGGSTAGPIAREVFDYYLMGKKPALKPLDPGADDEEHD
jgi:Cell division protein FtsI/penicillin-binding protein 2